MPPSIASPLILKPLSSIFLSQKSTSLPISFGYPNVSSTHQLSYVSFSQSHSFYVSFYPSSLTKHGSQLLKSLLTIPLVLDLHLPFDHVSNSSDQVPIPTTTSLNNVHSMTIRFKNGIAK